MTAADLVEVPGEEDAGTRLDRFCAARHPELSRSRLAALIRDGLVRVDGRTARPAERVAAGSRVEITVPPQVDARLVAEAIPLAIVFEDDHVLVLDKAAGIVVHPGAGNTHGTLAAALLHHDPALAGVGGEGRAGLVHRLDRGTTGLMVVARNAAAHRALQEQFRARTVEKVYHAVVWGRPRDAEGRIELPVGRHPSSRVKMSTSAPHGRDATSLFRVLKTVPGFALVEMQILTGRTHQVRVHLAAIGHPLVGDAAYGGDRAASVADPLRRRAILLVSRPLLHAARLSFDHPATGARVSFGAAWAPDMAGAWRAVGGQWP